MPDLPHIDGSDITSFPLDIFRTAIADHLVKTLNISLPDAFAGVDIGKKGFDFTVAIPRFRLPGDLSNLLRKIQADVSSILFENFNSA